MRSSRRRLRFDLIDGQRHTTTGLTLTGDAEMDRQQITEAVTRMRAQLPLLPEDPRLLISESADSSVKDLSGNAGGLRASGQRHSRRGRWQ